LFFVIAMITVRRDVVLGRNLRYRILSDIWLDNMLVAVVDDTGASPVIYYVHTDQLNRPQKMTGASASVVWDGVFDPFGNVTSVTGAATNLLMFPGQYYDSETQLSQNWFRDYDPTLGRYIQSDPIGLWVRRFECAR
jgi:RHS repeat-associated protein